MRAVLAVFLWSLLALNAADAQTICEQLTDSVAPCECILDDVLDCENVESGAQLLTIPGLHNGQSIGFREIRLQFNDQIEEIPDGAFGNHYATVSYMFQLNKNLKSIGRSVFIAPGNETLDPNHSFGISAEQNALEDFPYEDVRQLTGLKYLFLEENRLREIPPGDWLYILMAIK